MFSRSTHSKYSSLNKMVIDIICMHVLPYISYPDGVDLLNRVDTYISVLSKDLTIQEVLVR